MFLVLSSQNATVCLPVAKSFPKGHDDLIWKNGALKLQKGGRGTGVSITMHPVFCNLGGISCIHTHSSLHHGTTWYSMH